MTDTAKTLRTELTANVAAFYADEIDYVEFDIRNCTTWARIEDGPHKETVLAMLLEGLQGSPGC